MGRVISDVFQSKAQSTGSTSLTSRGSSTAETPRSHNKGIVRMKELRIILHRIDSIKIKKENGLPEPTAMTSFKQSPNRDDSGGFDQERKHDSRICAVPPQPRNQIHNDIAYNLCSNILTNIKTESDDLISSQKFYDVTTSTTTDPTQEHLSTIYKNVDSEDTKKKHFLTLEKMPQNISQNQNPFQPDKKSNSPPSDNGERLGAGATKIKLLNKNGVWTIVDKSSQLKEGKISSDTFDSSSTFTCEICGTIFNYISKERIIEHQKFHAAKEFEEYQTLSTGKKSYTCALCQRTFTKTTNLLRHLKIHNPETDLKCYQYQCENRFISQKHLNFHIQTAHEEEINPASSRFQKNESEIQNQNCERHLKIHNRLKCQHCEKIFMNESQLIRHSFSLPYEHGSSGGLEISTCYDQSKAPTPTVTATATPEFNQIHMWTPQSELRSNIPSDFNGMFAYHNPVEDHASNLPYSSAVSEVRPNILPHSNAISERRPNILPHSNTISDGRPNILPHLNGLPETHTNISNSIGISAWDNQHGHAGHSNPKTAASLSNGISSYYNQSESYPNLVSTYYSQPDRYRNELPNWYRISVSYKKHDARRPHPQTNLNGISSIYDNSEAHSSFQQNGVSFTHNGQPEGLLTRLLHSGGVVVSARYDQPQPALSNLNGIYPSQSEGQRRHSYFLNEMSTFYDQSETETSPTFLANSNEMTTRYDHPEQRPITTSPNLDGIHPSLSADFLNRTFKNGAERTCTICLIVFNNGADRLQHDSIHHGSTSTERLPVAQPAPGGQSEHSVYFYS